MHDMLITGASRGLGDALAKHFLKPGNRLFCAARSANPDLIEKARTSEVSLHYLQIDLAEDPAAGKLMEQWQQAQTTTRAQSVTLIHNAGILAPIGLIGKENAPESIQRAMSVNLGAVFQLTEAFVSATQALAIPKKVMVISSGAARRPVPGWSTYCSTKAATDRFMECLAAEQASEPYPVKASSLAPGVIDTDMQALIRSQDKADFPGVDRFLQLKADDALWSPDFTAAGVAAYLERADFGEQVIDDLRKHWGQGQ